MAEPGSSDFTPHQGLGRPGRGGHLLVGLESPLHGQPGSHWSAVSVMLGSGLLLPILVGLFFPETAQRSLEEIAPESGAAESPIVACPEEIA